MKRTRLLAILAIAMVAGLLVTGCDKQMGLPQDLAPDANIAWHWAPSTHRVFTIWAGQNQDAGTVTVWNDLTALHIEYKTTGNWKLEETHAHVATSLNGIPQKNGNPIPGQFDYSNTFSPPVTEKTYDIAFDGTWDEADSLYIATHCVVAEYVNGQGTNRQTGWSGPHDFPGKNWAKYITFRLGKDVRLPDFPVTMTAQLGDPNLPAYNGGGASYWLVTLSGIGPEGTLDPQGFRYDVWDDVWRGWCGELFNDLIPGVTQQVRLWSSIDPNLPDRCKDTMWDNINYLINHKVPGATAWDVQVTVWALKGNYDEMPPEFTWELWFPLAKQMYDEALAYGNGWYPGTGDWIAVITETREDVQLCFIEVDP